MSEMIVNIAATEGETTSQKAYIALTGAILAGAFQPGDILTQRALAKMLGVSEMPVREALKHLISEGALQALPNRSARIPILARREVEQIITLRCLLESRAAGLAAHNITSHQIQELKVIQEQIDATLPSRDLRKYTSLNRDFHFLIYGFADDATLLSLIRMLWLRMAPLLARSLETVKKPDELKKVASASHHRLIKAFVARDANAAADAMYKDLESLTKKPAYWAMVDEQFRRYSET
jgi:DNA-binding GntR family transcriptional regulator